MKRIQFAKLGLSLALAVAAASPAVAQNTTVFRQQGPRGHPATSAAPAATQPTPAPAYPPFPGSPYSPAYPRYPVAYTVLPAVIMSDGSVYADLGYGYVPVHQACATQYQQPQIIDGRGLLYSGGNPLTTTQPAPAQATPSQLNLPSAQAQRAANAASQPRVVSTCYRMDSYGPVVVVR